LALGRLAYAQVVREISAQELRQQLIEDVETLAADAQTQRQWADRHNFPIDELIQQFTDAWFVSCHRLLTERAVEDMDVSNLDALRDAAVRLLDEHEYPDPIVTSWEAVGTSREWKELRVLAGEVLRGLGA
jgi:hypothetical protein